MNRRPQLQLIAPSADPREAAAIVVALERFMRDSAPAPSPRPARTDGWLRAARLAGVRGGADEPTPWGDPHPWGRRPL